MKKYIRVYEDYYEQEYITTYQEHCEYVAGLQDAGVVYETVATVENRSLKQLVERYHDDICECIFEKYQNAD